MGEKIISVYWFAILLIVAAGVVAMVLVFYGKVPDVRGAEARFLSNQIADCIASGGEIKSDILSDNQFLLTNENFQQKCHLNFNTEKDYGWDNNQYFVRVAFENIGSASTGNSELETYCPLKTGFEKNLPRCLERSFYSHSNNKLLLIKISAVVRKIEKNGG